ncbi:histone-like nucleoid-structuring protein Lsr2 [Streptomyces sp. NPDC002886]|uniref:Lsr2 family DNA-binding protein n=1 Tax=Streptomyces sp. NPDC002886 TaxID=3364667 RepID=UPI00368172E1
MTDLAAIRRICPPPSTGQTTPIDWNAVETELGMNLPEDYKQLADIYGPGEYCDYINIYHPHAATPWVNLTGPMPARIRGQLQHDSDQGTHPVPYPPQHLFAIGVTSNGEYLFWITDPQQTPDNWRIAVNEARGPLWYTYDGTLTEFLTAVMTGQTTVPQFPRDLLDPPISFKPSTAPPTDYPQNPPRPAVDTETIREWARANGYAVPPHGRIPLDIKDAWEQANRP